MADDELHIGSSFDASPIIDGMQEVASATEEASSEIASSLSGIVSPAEGVISAIEGIGAAAKAEVAALSPVAGAMSAAGQGASNMLDQFLGADTATTDLTEKLEVIIPTSTAVAKGVADLATSFQAAAGSMDQLLGPLGALGEESDVVGEATANLGVSFAKSAEGAEYLLQTLGATSGELIKVGTVAEEVEEEINLAAAGFNNASELAAKMGQSFSAAGGGASKLIAGLTGIGGEAEELAEELSGAADKIGGIGEGASAAIAEIAPLETLINNLAEANRNLAISQEDVQDAYASGGVGGIAVALQEQTTATERVADAQSALQQRISQLNSSIAEQRDILSASTTSYGEAIIATQELAQLTERLGEAQAGLVGNSEEAAEAQEVVADAEEQVEVAATASIPVLQSVETLINNLTIASKNFAAAQSELKEVIASAGAGAQSITPEINTATIDESIGALAEYDSAEKELQATAGDAVVAIQNQEAAENELGEAQSALQQKIEQLNQTIAEQKEILASGGDYGDAIVATEALTEATEELAEAKIALAETIEPEVEAEAESQLVSEEVAAALQHLLGVLQATGQVSANISGAFGTLNNELGVAGTSADDFAVAVTTVNNAIAGLNRQLTGEIGELKLVEVAANSAGAATKKLAADAEEASTGSSKLAASLGYVSARATAYEIGLGNLGFAFGVLTRAIPALASAMSALFVVVGPILLVEVISQLVDKFTKLGDEIRKADRAFEDLGYEGEHVAEQIEVTNLKLEDTITKLTGGLPRNEIAEAAIEAKSKVDSLIQSLEKLIEKQLQDQDTAEIGFVKSTETKVTSALGIGDEKEQTTDVSKYLKPEQDALEDALTKKREANRSGNDEDKAAATEAVKIQADKVKKIGEQLLQLTELQKTAALYGNQVLEGKTTTLDATSNDKLINAFDERKKINAKGTEDEKKAAEERVEAVLKSIQDEADALKKAPPRKPLFGSVPEQADINSEFEPKERQIKSVIASAGDVNDSVKQIETLTKNLTDEAAAQTIATEKAREFSEQTKQFKADSSNVKTDETEGVDAAQNAYKARVDAIEKEKTTAIAAGESKERSELDIIERLKQAEIDKISAIETAQRNSYTAQQALLTQQSTNIKTNEVGTKQTDDLTDNNRAQAELKAAVNKQITDDEEKQNDVLSALDEKGQNDRTEIYKRGIEQRVSDVRTATSDLVNAEKEGTEETTRGIESGAEEQLRLVKDNESLHTLTISQARDQRLAILSSEQQGAEAALEQEKLVLENQQALIEASKASVTDPGQLKQLSKVYEELGKAIDKVSQEQTDLNTKLVTEQIDAQTDAWKKEESQVTDLTNTVTSSLNQFVVQISTTTGKAHALFVDMVVSIERSFLQMILKMIEDTALFKAAQNELKSVLDKVFQIKQPPTPASTATNRGAGPNAGPLGTQTSPGGVGATQGGGIGTPGFGVPAVSTAVTPQQIATQNLTTAIQALTQAVQNKAQALAGPTPLTPAPPQGTIPSIEAGTGPAPVSTGKSPDLDSLVNAISKQEGYGKPGAIPTKANNPGDLKIGDQGLGVQAHGETNFGSDQQGQDALRHQLETIGNGTSPVYNEHAKSLGLDNSSQLDLNQFGSKYAEDPNYGAKIASSLKVPPTTTVGSIVNQQPQQPQAPPVGTVPGLAPTTPPIINQIAGAGTTASTGAQTLTGTSPVPVTVVGSPTGATPPIPTPTLPTTGVAPVQSAVQSAGATATTGAQTLTGTTPIPVIIVGGTPGAAQQTPGQPTPQGGGAAGGGLGSGGISIAAAAASGGAKGGGQDAGEAAIQQGIKVAAAEAQKTAAVLAANTTQTASTVTAKTTQNAATMAQVPLTTAATTTETATITSGQAIQATAVRTGEASKTQATLAGVLARETAEAKAIALEIGHIVASVARFITGEHSKSVAAVSGEAAITGAKTQGASAQAAVAAASAAKTIAANATTATSNVATAATYAFVEAAATVPFPGDLVAAPAAAATIAAAGAPYVTLASAEQGGLLDKDQLVNAHANEMILPANLSQGIQNLIEGKGQNAVPAVASTSNAVTQNIAAAPVTASPNIAAAPAAAAAPAPAAAPSAAGSASSAQSANQADTNIGTIAQNSITTNQYSGQVAANTEDMKEDLDQMSGNNKYTHELNKITGGMLGAGGLFTPPGAFAKGGLVDKDGPIFAHAREMVLPSHLSEGIQGLIEGGGDKTGRDSAASASSSASKSEHDISRAQAQMQQMTTNSQNQSQYDLQIQNNTQELVEQGKKQQSGGFGSFFHTVSMGLFEDGGITSGGPALLHPNEMVLPSPISQGFQNLFSSASSPGELSLALASSPEITSATSIAARSDFDFDKGATVDRDSAASDSSQAAASRSTGVFHYHDHTNVSSWDSKDTGDFMQDNKRHLANAFSSAAARGMIDPKKLRGGRKR